jgi:hypothetical protein
MLETTCQVYDIQRVTEVVPCDEGHRVTFQGGLTATLSADHPDRDLLLAKAERHIHWPEPVGMLIDANGRIIDLNHTYQVSVCYVRDDKEDPNRLMVAFWGYCAICYLTRDHPEFERIRTTLMEALASATEVVFANHCWPIEGETEIWNKLLDVRPTNVPGVRSLFQ